MNELSVDTLEAVREKAVEFARREWRAGEIKRSDAITDFISDIDEMIDVTKRDHKQSFELTLKNVREAMQIMATHCIGCSVLVTEGAHSYTVPSDVDADGVCKFCHKPKYKRPQI